MARAILLSPFYPVSNALDTSHRGGWARYWANELKHSKTAPTIEMVTTENMFIVDELKKGDVIYVYHGMEFKGQLNLQSGLTDEILARVRRMNDAFKKGVKVISLDGPMPNYGKLFGERGMDPTSAEALTKGCAKVRPLLVPNADPDNIVVGDSHSLAMYTPGTVVVRNDAKTLHGAIEYGIMRYLEDLEFETGIKTVKRKRLSFYFGNIDIRHHIMRQPNPTAAIKQLVNDYVAQLCTVQTNCKPKVLEVVMPLPIEDESRVLPKSIMFKGEPFAGTWSERHQLRLAMRDQLKRLAKKHGFATYEHPKHFIGKDGKLPFDVMEKPRSVHIRPAEYRLVHEGASWLV